MPHTASFFFKSIAKNCVRVNPFMNSVSIAVSPSGSLEKGVIYIMKSDDGRVRDSTVKIGDSLVIVSSGSELYDTMPGMLHL